MTVIGILAIFLGLSLTAVSVLRPQNVPGGEIVISLGIALIGAWLVGVGT